LLPPSPIIASRRFLGVNTEFDPGLLLLHFGHTYAPLRNELKAEAARRLKEKQSQLTKKLSLQFE
jgi:hypothetical protein